MNPPQPRLLLVDDDPSAIRLMSRMLADYPDQRFATSGDAALRLARELRPDLILLDADMPGMTGLDVCDQLRADARLADVPVIVATSHHAPLLEAAMLERGAVDFVNKPLIASQLTARVKAHLRAHRRGPVPRAAHRPAGAAAAPAPTVPQILLIDDDVVSIRLLRRALDGLGDFRFACDAQAALAAARRHRPDLIVLDGHLPEVDGFDICATLRAEAEFESVPIVFVTRFGDPRNERRAFDLGASDFVTKPYSPVVLHARVRNLLEPRRPPEEPASALVSPHEAAVERRSVMLSCVAHEANNALNALLGFAELMTTDVAEPLPDGQRRWLGHLTSGARQLQRLVRDLSDIGRLEAGQLSVLPTVIDLVPCLVEVLAGASPAAHDAGIELRAAQAPAALHVTADAARLRQCLANLIGNAIKYNHRGGWVSIEVVQAADVAISVCDGGLGFETTQPGLFEPFNRLGREAGSIEGSGLGLAITRMLVEAMGGRLAVESRVGAGSRFTIVLPTAPAPCEQGVPA